MEDQDQDQVRQQILRNTIQEVKNRDESENDSADPCVICLDSISEPAIAVPCQHSSFDFLCLVSWLQEQPTCPLCKAQVKHVRYELQHPNGAKVYDVPSLPQSSQPPTERSIASGNLRSQRAPFPRNRRPRSQRLLPPLDPDSALLRRRQIYREQLYSLHVGSNRLSRFRDLLTPQEFARDGELISRARKWIRRELQVFEFLGADGGSGSARVPRRSNNAEFLLEYIVAILKTVEIKGSGGQAEDMLQDFLGRDNARLFLHELRAWLRSPYTELQDWDRWVQYNDSQTQNSTPTAGTPSASSSSSSYERERDGQAQSSRANERRQREGDTRTIRGQPRRRGQRGRFVDRYEPYNGRTTSTQRGSAIQSPSRLRC